MKYKLVDYTTGWVSKELETDEFGYISVEDLLSRTGGSYDSNGEVSVNGKKQNANIRNLAIGIGRKSFQFKGISSTPSSKEL